MKEFKPRVTRKYIGTYRPRIDGFEKATGTQKYINDITTGNRFPGLLYAKILRSPYPNAKIKKLDTSKAEKLPGVKVILTYKDDEVASVNTFCTVWGDGCESLTYDRTFFPHARDRRLLDNHVRWVGDEAGVVVAAESERIAEDALKLLDIEWEVLPFALDPFEAMKPESPVIHPETNPGSNIIPPDPKRGSHVLATRGDLEKAFKEADVVVETTAIYHNPSQGVLDSWCCLAEWEDDLLTIWANTYKADQTRLFIGEMLGIPLNKVRIIATRMGGSHGRNDDGEQAFFLFVALLAKKAGRPVKYKHTRREEFHDTRSGEIGTCTIAAKKNGKITGMHLKLIGDAGAYAQSTLGAIEYVPDDYIHSFLEQIPTLKVESYGVYTNKIPGGCMRGIGNSQLNLIVGKAIDVLSEKLGIDPIKIGINNFNSEYLTLPNKSLKAILTKGAKRIGWSKRHKPGEGPVYEGTKKRGLGLSFHHSWHAAWQEKHRGPIQIIIKINPDATVYLEAPTIETGPGSDTCYVLSCAEALGVPVESIHWTSVVDTETGLKDQVQTDSALSHVIPEIIHLAAKNAKEKIFVLAAKEFKVKPEDLDIKDGIIFTKKSPRKQITLKELLWKGYLIPILGVANQVVPTEKTGVPYVAAFAEVEVDTATGAVEIIKLVIINDCGTVMHASGTEAQQVGGQCIGIGQTLTEETIYDEASGVPLNFNFIDFKIPTMADFPEIEPVPMEVWRGAGQYGACGIGESVLTCTPTAITNAIYNAIGIRVDDIPITPNKILKALHSVGDN